MNRTWDYIPPITADAATQMAIDAELADLCNRDGPRAFLRFYTMSPPAVTIGRNQQWRAVIDPQLCQRKGWDWVRRPTGGGALLHHREINYAVAISHDLLSGHSREPRVAVFNLIAQGLLAGLVHAGLHPVITSARKARSDGGPSSAHGLCGAALTRFEISIEGRKAIAAAQLNLAQASLQHGTIYLKAPRLEDRFWPVIGDTASSRQSWWAWEDSGLLSGDPWMVASEALKHGVSQQLEIAWRPNSTDWAASANVSARKCQWLAELWHPKR